jgi:protein-disulfide isomerase
LAQRRANATFGPETTSAGTANQGAIRVINRRQFVAGASLLAIAAALNLSLPALPATAAPTELMVPPALGDMSLGNPSSPVTVIEYASLWCSHCGQFYKTVYPELKKRYIDTGKINFIFREYPLNDRGAIASMLARCAAEQGGKDKFFAMVDVLFEKQESWAYVRDPGPPLLAIAKQAGFSEQAFKACTTDQKLLNGLQAEQDRATKKFGVSSTPTIFVNGNMVRGAASIDDLAKMIDPLLKTTG